MTSRQHSEGSIIRNGSLLTQLSRRYPRSSMTYLIGLINQYGGNEERIEQHLNNTYSAQHLYSNVHKRVDHSIGPTMCGWNSKAANESSQASLQGTKNGISPLTIDMNQLATDVEVHHHHYNLRTEENVVQLRQQKFAIAQLKEEVSRLEKRKTKINRESSKLKELETCRLSDDAFPTGHDIEAVRRQIKHLSSSQSGIHLVSSTPQCFPPNQSSTSVSHIFHSASEHQHPHQGHRRQGSDQSSNVTTNNDTLNAKQQSAFSQSSIPLEQVAFFTPNNYNSSVWTCNSCTYLNQKNNTHCMMCGSGRLSEYISSVNS